MTDSVDSARKNKVIEDLRNQIEVEHQLVKLYEEQEEKTEFQALKRLMRMYSLDSLRHINILEAAIENIEGEETFLEDRAVLAATLGKHLELESEALGNVNKILSETWVDENWGLKGLLQLWRDDERRHHAALRKIVERPYFRLERWDLLALFRGVDWLEERHKRRQRLKEKYEKK
jgi:rubrerythrin